MAAGMMYFVCICSLRTDTVTVTKHYRENVLWKWVVDWDEAII